ncbi:MULTISPECIES: SRPBCC family protein [unclassified Aureimonas]|uniref:SRPBCC family protein n=1 Tax=unclassified Aureimonas TaxID=2615206 RepID=UPI0006F76223|nr:MULTISPECIES: hypothetical protein [unclassified Aureimonas]KQT64293.1 hypothetical protein ASG62_04705 [Aureimonas sp. Leaf427]KQT81482.1 hypothetical protein ASG54_01970 [Aureimonas sp. Leaf460]
MTDETSSDLVLDYDLDAPPHKVWRAIHIAEIRRRWLPDEALADPAPIETIPEREVRYRMREALPPFLESVVRFQLAPDGHGGTRLRITHQVTHPRRTGPPGAGNGNVMCFARAA